MKAEETQSGDGAELRHRLAKLETSGAERHQAELALRESEELHRITLSHISDAVFITDAAGVLTYVCPNVDVIFGYSVAEVKALGRIAALLGANLFDPHDLETRGEIPNIERAIRDKVGREHILLINVKRVAIQGGTVLYTCRDITDRKRAEEALRESEARYRALVEFSSDHIFLLDRDGTYLFSNNQVGHFELSDGQVLVGHHLRDVYPPGGADFYLEQLERVLTTGRTVDIEYALNEPGGPYYRLDTLYPIHRGHEVWAVGGLGRDITARKRAEQALKKAHEELERRVAERTAELVAANEALQVGQQRLQTLSHRLVEVQETERRRIARELHDEIGQTLTGLKLLLEMSGRLPADAARSNLDGALALVHDLMGRVRELSLDLRPAMLDDLGLLPALLWHFERYQAQTQVQIAFRHNGLEGRRFAPEVETAAYRIIQEALTNVARHAQVREASVRVWADSKTLSLQVVDQGIGFDPEVALAAETTGGLLGMRERAVLLGGELTLESAPGAGTRVRAEWPLGDPRGG